MNHASSVGALALTSDGSEIVSADVTGQVRRWNRLSGEALFPPLTAHDRSIWAVLLSPDDKEIITSGSDGTVRRWERGSARPIGEPFTVHTDWIRALALASDGREFLTAAQDGVVRRWDLASGIPLGEPLTGHNGAVRAIAVTPDGSEIITVGQDGTIRRWDRNSGSPLAAPVVGHPGGISALALNSDGSEILTAGRDAVIRRWDRATGRPIGDPFAGHTAAIRGLSLTSGDSEIVTGGSDGTIRSWERATGRPIGAPVKTGQGSVWALALTPDGTEIITAGWDGSIRRWDRLSGAPALSSGDDTRPITAIVLTAGPNPSVLGEVVTVAATATGPDAAAPTGDVTFTDAEVGAGTRMLGRAPLTAGSASLSVPDLPVGTHFITGSYGGDSSFRPSSGVVARRVEEVGSRTDAMSLAQHFLSQSATRAGEGRRAEAVAAARAAVDVLHGIEVPAGHEVQYFLLLAEALHSLVGRLVTAGRVGEVEGFAEEAVGVYRRAAGVSSGEMVLDRAPYLLSLSSLMAGLGPGGVAVSAARAAVDVLHGIEVPAGHEVQYFLLLAEALHS
ncbi:Ig-like domain repeat protein, partial [Streptomyces sp. NPDC054766]